MIIRKKIVVALFSLLIASVSNTLLADPWKFEIAPYLWAINMSGRVQVGPVKAHVAENFEDILHQLEGAGMIYADAHKDNVGFFANVLYTVLEKSDKTGPITITARNKFGLFSAGASYDVYKKSFGQCLCDLSQITISPYLGLRYTLNNTSLKIDHLSTVSDNKHWTDPIIGAKLLYNVNKNWLALLAGDVGGTNFNDHNSYNVQGYVGYKPTRAQCVTLYAGYRLLYQHYVTCSGLSKYDWTMKLFGPVLGLSFGF